MKDETQPLSPLATRLAGALLHASDEFDELKMIVNGFVRHMKRNPYTDDEIRGTLTMVREHIDTILADEPKSHTA